MALSRTNHWLTTESSVCHPKILDFNFVGDQFCWYMQAIQLFISYIRVGSYPIHVISSRTPANPLLTLHSQLVKAIRPRSRRFSPKKKPNALGHGRLVNPGHTRRRSLMARGTLRFVSLVKLEQAKCLVLHSAAKHAKQAGQQNNYHMTWHAEKNIIGFGREMNEIPHGMESAFMSNYGMHSHIPRMQPFSWH